jgi:hypothetical protein
VLIDALKRAMTDLTPPADVARCERALAQDAVTAPAHRRWNDVPRDERTLRTVVDAARQLATDLRAISQGLIDDWSEFLPAGSKQSSVVADSAWQPDEATWGEL